MFLETVLGSSPASTIGEKAEKAAYKAARTLIQGVAGAFPSAGAGTVVLSTGYWQTFGYVCIAAAITALVSFLQNVAEFLPDDPTQK
ncbi:MAG: hypothetical protein ACRC0L_07180 [Angustibacter sp.]